MTREVQEVQIEKETVKFTKYIACKPTNEFDLAKLVTNRDRREH